MNLIKQKNFRYFQIIVIVFALFLCYEYVYYQCMKEKYFIDPLSYLFNDEKLGDEHTSWSNTSVKSDVIFTSREQSFLIDTEGYKLPYFDPFDPSIYDKYLKDIPRKELNCSREKRSLTSSKSIKVEPSDMHHYILLHKENFDDYGGAKDISCCFQKIRGQKPQNESFMRGKGSHKARYWLSIACFPLINESTEVNEGGVLVSCSVKSRNVYKNVHVFPKNERVPMKDPQNIHQQQSEEKISVLILGVDSLSRLNAIRYMPKTIKALKMLDSIELKGYNKVGENTFPNVMPLLTGKPHNHPDTLLELEKAKNRFDNVSFIWKEFSSSGYTTAFVEDCPKLGTFFYNRQGFSKPPTNYYLSPYLIAMEENKVGHSGMPPRAVNCKQCYGSKITVEVLLKYMETLINATYQRPQFSFLWSTAITHELLTMAVLIDDHFATFFEKMQDNPVWNNTIIFFLSDHGMRFGNFRKSFIGKKEESLPVNHIVLPKWFSKKYPIAYTNLKKNMYKLTTPFDVHQTLNDIVNGKYKDEIHLKQDTLNLHRTISLFKEIPGNRNCLNAEIPLHYCAGQFSIKVSPDTKVTYAAKTLLNTINNALSNYSQCAKLIEFKILKSYEVKFYALQEKMDLLYYEIQITTSPGNAPFEALIAMKVNSTGEPYEGMVIGAISRINKYKEQSSCVTQESVKKFCIC